MPVEAAETVSCGYCERLKRLGAAIPSGEPRPYVALNHSLACRKAAKASRARGLTLHGPPTLTVKA